MPLITLAALLQLAALPAHEGDLLRDARKAQVRFETVRRSHLPWNRSGGSAGHCDARIGRYCYWYDSTRIPVSPEPSAITMARARLIALLDSAARVHPGDAWIAGQRVRYLLEADDAPGALRAAHRCRAERWWCAALEGLALHVGGWHGAADSVYSAALGEMPNAQRCQWTDLRRLTEADVERDLRAASCGEREAIANRLWELGRPMWSLGNDLRTEHLARETMAAALAGTANAHGMTWADDSRELLVRYGWAEWFTRSQSDIGGASSSPRVTGHDREPSYHFFPDVASQGPPRVTSASWTLTAPMARTRYAPRYLEGLSDLPHQLARFPRGDSMLVAVAFGVADTALARDSQAVHLVHRRQVGDEGQASTQQHREGIMVVMTPREPIIVSLEVLGHRSKHAARARYTVDALRCASSWCLSDLVLLDAASGPVAAELEAVLPRAAAVLRFASGAPLGLYWETEGGDGGEATLTMTLTVSPLRPGIARRVATRLKLAPDLTPVRMRWQAAMQGNRRGQFLTLQLPRNARGRYRVSLSVEPPGAPALVAAREIELVP